MAYLDQPAMSTRKIVSIALVALLHVLIGYAFITGLAFNVVKKVAQDLKTFDVQDEPPPPEEKPPPPPPEQKIEPPPMVSPPPIVQTQVISAPVIQTVRVAPPPVITPTAPVAPPPPPAPPAISKAAGIRGSVSNLFSEDDYPPSALRNEEQGTVGMSFTVNTQGRIENCSVSASSGSSTLDETACRLLTRRGRYTPAQDAGGAPVASRQSLRFTWRLPRD